MTEFCERCNNILDISRSISNEYMISDTPDTLSETTDTDNVTDAANTDVTDTNTLGTVTDTTDYEDILRKIEKGQKLSEEEIMSIDIKELVQDDYYKKMGQKNKIKKIISDMIEDQDNADDKTQAYYVCKNCYYHKKIQPGTRVLSKNAESSGSNVDNIINESTYRNRVHQRTIPSTRNFNCSNDKCPSHTNKVASEAKFFRMAGTYNVVYVCVHCLTIKLN